MKVDWKHIGIKEFAGIISKKLRDNGSDVKVIMVTGVEDDSTIREAESLGILGYVHKPLVLDELQKIVLKELENLS